MGVKKYACELIWYIKELEERIEVWMYEPDVDVGVEMVMEMEKAQVDKRRHITLSLVHHHNNVQYAG